MSDPQDEPNGRLPALAPDLAVARDSTGGWRVQRLSPRLARLAGLSQEGAGGRGLAALFPRAVPSLVDLATEAAEGNENLSGIRVRLAEGAAIPLVVDVRPGGLSDDYRSEIVTFRFREPAADESGRAEAFCGIVGTGPAMGEVFRKIGLYAPSDAAVVITGETGTGKELVARALHERSGRQGRAFVAVNCSAISEELLESELFGHEKGAFTGAVRTHRGRFERAHLGTLFLDEIGEMPLHTQAKLLRVLEEGRIERVGAEEERAVDVRILCATNVPLEQAVGRGRFRADLYHRLSVLRIHIPPLRERPEDIPALAGHFLRGFNRKYQRHVERLTPEALALLQSYLWPGNVRELRNVLERVYVETRAEVISARAFGEWVRERQDFAPGGWDLKAAAERRPLPLSPPYPLPSETPLLAAPADGVLEAELLAPRKRPSTRPADLDEEEIRRAYAASGGNLTAAARLLGVHRATLYRYLRKLRLDRRDLEG